MNSRLDELLREIRELENNVQQEMLRKEEELKYSVRNGKVRFEEERAVPLILPSLALDACLWADLP